MRAPCAADVRRAGAHARADAEGAAPVPGVHDRRPLGRPDRGGRARGDRGRARPRPRSLEALATADAIVIGPSNPVISIGPILAVPGMRDALREAPAPVVAVSPFVGGHAVKGPTDDFCRSAGIELSAQGIADAYRDVIDAIVADEPVEGVPALVTDTLMNDAADAARARPEDPGFCGICCPRLAPGERLVWRRRRMRTLAILPVKSFGAAKQRLVRSARPGLTRGARPGDVLRRARIAAQGEGARRDRGRHRRRARRVGRPRRTRARAARPRRDRAVRRHADRDPSTRSSPRSIACCSCPATRRCSTRSRSTACSRARPPSTSTRVIVPDRAGTGTNALLLRPPDAFEPSFGPGSLERHIEAASHAGIKFRVERVRSLMHDVDTPDDLADLGVLLEERRGVAPRTRGALHQLDHSKACAATRPPAAGHRRAPRPSDLASRSPRAARGAARRRPRGAAAAGRRRRHRRRLAQGRVEGGGAGASTSRPSCRPRPRSGWARRTRGSRR